MSKRADGMPDNYSGHEYVFSGNPTERCPTCGQVRNTIQVHRVIGGGQILRLLHPRRRARAHPFGRALDAGARAGRRAVMRAA